MVRKSKEELHLIKELFEKYKEKVFINNNWAKKTNPIWKEMAESVQVNISSNALYTAAIKNYYDLHNIVNYETDYIADEELNTYSSTSSNSSSNENINNSTNLNDFSFFINLTIDEFKNNLGPRLLKYGIDKRSPRNYFIFKQRTWFNFLYDKIKSVMDKENIKCCITFKRGKIHPNSDRYFANIYAKCKECEAIMEGKIYTFNESSDVIKIEFVLQGNYRSKHSVKFSRPFSGEQRKSASKYLIKTNIAPSHYQKISASESDNKLRDIPSVSKLQTAVHELKKKQQLDVDQVLSACKAKVDPKYKGAIRNIGICPFFVYYWTNVQLHVYNKYVRNGYSKLSIDAT